MLCKHEEQAGWIRLGLPAVTPDLVAEDGFMYGPGAVINAGSGENCAGTIHGNHFV